MLEYLLYWIVYKLNILNRIHFVHVSCTHYYLGIENPFPFETGGLSNEYGPRTFAVLLDRFGSHI